MNNKIHKSKEEEKKDSNPPVKNNDWDNWKPNRDVD